MPKINREEYDILKQLDDEWKWIARDEGQQTYAYEYRPIKSKLRGQWESNWNDFYPLPHDWLQFIQWEDENPYNIAELIEEYEADESHKKTMDDNLRPHLPNLFKESEETEVKDLEWLKSWFKNEKVHYQGKYINSKIDQLDEPKVLSQEFIDEHKQHITGLGADKNNVDQYHNAPFVSVYDLQNLLVPKQEEITEEQAWRVLGKKFDWASDGLKYNVTNLIETLEKGAFMADVVKLGSDKSKIVKKPTIPQFVADFLEKEKRRNAKLYSVMSTALNYVQHSGKWGSWANENKYYPDIIARAWLDGFTVKEEQRYNVKFKVKSSFGTVGIFLYKEGDEVLAGDNFRAYYPKEDEYRLTEQEIRDFQNGDILFEHFAVKVEELEE